MTITLEGQEALDYINQTSALVETVARLEARVTKLENTKPVYVPPETFGKGILDTIPCTVSDAIVSPSVDYKTQMMKDVQFAKDSNFAVPLETPRFKERKESKEYVEGITRASSSKDRWSETEINLLRYRIDPKSTAADSERKLAVVLLKMPTRTEAAIRTKIRLLDGCIKSGVICQA